MQTSTYAHLLLFAALLCAALLVASPVCAACMIGTSVSAAVGTLTVGWGLASLLYWRFLRW